MVFIVMFFIIVVSQIHTGTGEQILELTCTEQLQKWHRKTTKGSGANSFLIAAADSEQSYFKRDVPAIINELNKKLDKEKPVNEYFYSVLSQSSVGRNSSLGHYLCYKFELNQRGDHQYVSKQKFESKSKGKNKSNELS